MQDKNSSIALSCAIKLDEKAQRDLNKYYFSGETHYFSNSTKYSLGSLLWILRCAYFYFLKEDDESIMGGADGNKALEPLLEYSNSSKEQCVNDFFNLLESNTPFIKKIDWKLAQLNGEDIIPDNDFSSKLRTMTKDMCEIMEYIIRNDKRMTNIDSID